MTRFTNLQRTESTLYLLYSYLDDGVHVVCSVCNFDRNVGFKAWIPELLEAEEEHNQRIGYHAYECS
jgi:hypothetical protein